MNFGSIGFMEMVLVLLAWALPLALLIWFVRTLSAMAGSLRDIAERLRALEQAVRNTTTHRGID
jgi:uncharacterized protein YoxC